MEKVKQGLHLLIDSLQPGDRLALVQFDDVIDVLSTLAAPSDAAALHAQVAAMYPRGATNIYDSLAAGFEVAVAALDPARQNRVILLSDGIATAGELSGGWTISMADGYISEGISLSTIGVGLEHDAYVMRTLAEHGAGNYYFLEDAAAVNEVFTQELETYLTPLALDLTVSATSSAGYLLAEAIGGGLWTSNGYWGQTEIPAVFIASRDVQQPDPGRRGGGGSIFVDLYPVRNAIDDGQVAQVSVSYRLPGSSEVITQTVDLTSTNPPGELSAETYVSTQAMMEHYAAYNLFLGLREATRLAAYNYDCALSALTALRDSATRFNSVFADPDVTADIALIDQFSQNLIAAGADSEAAPTQGQCRGYFDDGGDTIADGGAYGCADSGAGRGGAMTLLLVAAALLGVRRSR
jgi:Ca-activated chloride channel family protein